MTRQEWNEILAWADERWPHHPWPVETEDALYADLAPYTATSVRSILDMLYRRDVRDDRKGFRPAPATVVSFAVDLGDPERTALPEGVCPHPRSDHGPAYLWIPSEEEMLRLDRVSPTSAEEARQHGGRILIGGIRFCLTCGKSIPCPCPACRAVIEEALR